jgi:alanine-glyoxylate transaminase/serine-glyoxylate transaminase/serine-pyruvate transaminase
MSGQSAASHPAAQDTHPRPAVIRLMIPGPVPLTPTVTAEFGRPVEAHYGPAWADLYHDTVSLLRGAFGSTVADVFPIVGSGSTGLEAAIGSLTDVGDHVVVCVNGYFGERLATIARGLGAEVHEVSAAWGTRIEPDAVNSALTRLAPGIAAVLVTHVETSTGACNPVPELAAIARRHGVPIVVDAISSLGGMAVAIDDWGIDVCVGASQKCLGAPAGLAPVAVAPSAWPIIERRRSPRGWYLDLLTWRALSARDAAWHPHPVTMPTNAVRALRQALHELRDEGLAARADRLRSLGDRVRAGLRSIELEPLAADPVAAPVVTAFRTPAGSMASDVVGYVEREHGIRIAAGAPGPRTSDLVRIGHMAPSVSERDIDDVITALEACQARARVRSAVATTAGPAR